MFFEEFLFSFFTCFLIISSFCCLLSANTIHSMVFLILIFCNASFLLILLNVEFLGLLFLIVYVGAIAILFIFIVMMLNIRSKSTNIKSPIELLFFLCLFLFSLSFIIIYFDGIANYNVFLDSSFYHQVIAPKYVWTLTFGQNSIDVIGFFLYTYYPCVLIFVGLTLFVGLLGAVVISFNSSNIQLRTYSLWRYKNSISHKKQWYV